MGVHRAMNIYLLNLKVPPMGLGGSGHSSSELGKERGDWKEQHGRKQKQLLLLKSWRRHKSSCSQLIQEEGFSSRTGGRGGCEGCSFWVENGCTWGWEFGDASEGCRFREELRK